VDTVNAKHMFSLPEWMIKTEISFRLSDEVITAIKMKAVQDKIRYSDVAEDLLRSALGLKPRLKEVKVKEKKK
jgi:predicted DNA binding CopG/RHH family protein